MHPARPLPRHPLAARTRDGAAPRTSPPRHLATSPRRHVATTHDPRPTTHDPRPEDARDDRPRRHDHADAVAPPAPPLLGLGHARRAPGCRRDRAPAPDGRAARRCAARRAGAARGRLRAAAAARRPARQPGADLLGQPLRPVDAQPRQELCRLRADVAAPAARGGRLGRLPRRRAGGGRPARLGRRRPGRVQMPSATCGK